VLFFVFVWKSYLRALALICSVSIVIICGWYVQSAIQRYLYITEILTTPHFDEKCGPASGIPLGDDTLRVCSRYSFASYEKLIVKISGSYPTERLIDDINSGKIKAAAGVHEWWIRPNTVIGYTCRPSAAWGQRSRNESNFSWQPLPHGLERTRSHLR
jgi:hypothetical protein